eukprot:359540-Chlamydomonas_euryale.AAC.8
MDMGFASEDYRIRTGAVSNGHVAATGIPVAATAGSALEQTQLGTPARPMHASSSKAEDETKHEIIDFKSMIV